jgi:hypothetical protein
LVARDGLCLNEGLDQAGFEAIRAMAALVVRKRAPLVEELGWTEQAALELTHELFARENASDRLKALCEKATSATSFDSLLYRALDNLLLDLHRQTPVGAAGRRIKKLVAQQDRFVKVDAARSLWAVRERIEGRWDGNEEALIAAVSGFTFEPVEYDSESRRSPVLSNDDLSELLALALQAAEGPVPLAVLVRVVRQRTGLGATPTFVELNENIDGEERETSDEVGDETVARAEAERFVERLDDYHRQALLYRDLSLRALAEELGVSRSKAETIRKELQGLFEPFRNGVEDPAVVRNVVEIIENKAGRR